MAVYKEIDGKIVLVEEDVTQNQLHKAIQQQREQAGEATSTCIKDSFALPVAAPEEME